MTTRSGLVLYFVLFVVALEIRSVEIAGISSRPNGEWMKQVARYLTGREERFLNGACCLIHDRDPLFPTSFRAVSRSWRRDCEASRSNPNSRCLRGAIHSFNRVALAHYARRLWEASEPMTGLAA